LTQVTPIPKPRKKIENRGYLRWLMTKPCLYCGNPALEPHHVRWGQGDGKGSGNSKPDDYRAIPTCWECHGALEGTKPTRLKWMTERIGREEVYSCMVDNLIEWISVSGGGVI